MTEKDNRVKITFNPDNVEIRVEKGTNLLEAAIAAGMHVYASCGGGGTCGTCKVIIEDGQVETVRTAKVSDAEFAQGVRQSCQSKAMSDLIVFLPVESRLEKAVQAREQKKVSEVIATGWRFKPPLSKYFVEMPAPTSADNAPDVSRLLRALKSKYNLGNITIDFSVVKKLAETLRQADWKVTVTALVTAGKPGASQKRPRIINIQPGDTRQRHYSIAIDIGTTTVVGQILDLNRGQILANDIEFNRQISYGQDVISRIAYCLKPGGLDTLHKAVIDSINSVIGKMLAEAHIDIEDVGHITCAGNTAMTQILMGLDPKYIRLGPYVPVANFFPVTPAATVGINVPENVQLFVFPAISSYVGGDIVSGVIGAGIHQRSELTYFIDIGTNGEIVIGNSDWMVTASCSAGPAFEGAGIRFGMVAMQGAIQDVNIDPVTYEPKIGTIGDAKPRGICGSGLINLIASLMETGLIGQNGKFNHLPIKRIRVGEDGYEYVISWAPETQIGKDIVITEVDIDNLMRAKAAMFAGCQTLAESVGLKTADFEKVIIAGAFGNSLNIERAITIGLLPDLPLERFAFIGNGSLLGARLTSFSVDLLDDARRVAAMMTNFELSENNNFMERYMAALFLPHTDAAEFPNVTRRLQENMKKRKSA